MLANLHRALSKSLWHDALRTVAATQWRSTTILCVRKGADVVIMGDGMVSMGNEIVKPNVKKVRKIGETAVGGFAGTTADAFTLFERLESKLEEHQGQLQRAAVELAKAWRTDKFLRRLEASLLVADKKVSLQISGNGDVLEPHDGIMGIGSGGTYAVAAARALMTVEGLSAKEIAERSMKIAADICIHTNHNFQLLAVHNEEQEEQSRDVEQRAPPGANPAEGHSND